MSAVLELDDARRTAWLPVVAGCLALSARGLTVHATVATAVVGLLGLLVPGRDVPGRDVATRDATATRARWIAAVAVGVGAFGVARMMGSPVGIRTTGWGIVTLAIVSVAEESFFRRYVYAWTSRWGAAAAVAVAGVTFALVHVPIYGMRALPVDLAAGLLLGWQRWAAGTWTAPALTHFVADLFQLGW